MNASPFKNSLFWISLAVVAAAAWLWNGRQERHHEAAVARAEVRAARRSQNAAALLVRAFHADNFLTYAAISNTRVLMGKREMVTVARLVHAPRRLSITYLQGDYAGLNSGYNEQWSWRQVSVSQPMIPYVEMERQTTDMAAQRFALLLENYSVVSRGREQIAGREAQVLEINPYAPAEGAQGPAKKLWIDDKTGLTLRMQCFNYQNIPVMDSTLTKIDLAPPIGASTFVPPHKLREVARLRPWMAQDSGEDELHVAKLTGLFPPRPNIIALPAGFEFDSVGAHRYPSSTTSTPAPRPAYAALSRFTDGLNTLTIFAIPPACAASTKSGEQSCDFGTGTIVMRATPQGALIAVADLPEAVLKRVLDVTTIRRYDGAR